MVVENKLDDSGRDVVWQALKYVAYCSSLKKAEIGEIYQKYLDRWFEGADAAANLCEFLGVEELDDVVLNAGNEQRLVLIAENFRKEVSAATVRWETGRSGTQGLQGGCEASGRKRNEQGANGRSSGHPNWPGQGRCNGSDGQRVLDDRRASCKWR